MSRVAHIIVFLGYAVLAAVVGYTFPGGVLNFEDNAAWLLGMVVFLAGLLAHETIARRLNETTA